MVKLVVCFGPRCCFLNMPGACWSEGEVNSRPLWLGSKLSVFGLVVFGRPDTQLSMETV